MENVNTNWTLFVMTGERLIAACDMPLWILTT